MGFYSFIGHHKKVAFIAFGSIVPLIIGLVGVGLYAKATRDVKYYKESTCYVSNAYVKTNTCSRRNCHGSTSDQHCTTQYYDCYEAYWEVQYLPIDATKEYSALISSYQTDSYIYAWNEMNDHSQGGSYECFYDSTDYDEVQWTFPNPTPFFYMMVVCLPVFGACWIGITSYYIIRKIRKQFQHKSYETFS